jgi:hypothetical protein
MAWDDRLTRLQRVLAELYPREAEARAVVSRAEVRAGLIVFDSAPLTNWYGILSEADNQGRIDNLIRVALDDRPERQDLRELLTGSSSRALHIDPRRRRHAAPVSRQEADVDAPQGAPAIQTAVDPWPAGWFYLALLVLLGVLTLLLVKLGISAIGVVAVVGAIAAAAAVVSAFLLRWYGKISEPGLMRLATLGLRALHGRSKGEASSTRPGRD